MSSENDIPSIFVDEDLIKKTANENVSFECCDKRYIVNGEVFIDHQDTTADTDYHAFEIYTLKDMEEENMEDIEALQTMEVSLTPMQYGYIINDTIYLPEHQWHTIIFMDITLLHCAVCDFYTTLNYVGTHIDTDAHAANLDLHKPLLEFDLSITRKLRDKYHCGVCNQIIALSESGSHFNSKLHEANLLFAINKATDFMSEQNQPQVNKRKDVYHYNERNMSSGNSSLDKERDNMSETSNEYYSGEDDACSPNNYRDIMFNVPNRQENRMNNDSISANIDNIEVNNDNFGVNTTFGINTAIITENIRKFVAKNLNFDAVKNKQFEIPGKAKGKEDQFWDNNFEQDSDEDVNNVTATNNDNEQTTNNTDNDNNNNDYTETITRNIDYYKGTDYKYPKEAFGNNTANYEDVDENFDFDAEFYDMEALYSSNSYANKAKKPKEYDEIIEIDFGENRVTIEFDSYHMIIYPKANCFYCMACKGKDHISLKWEHCKSDKHIDFLTNCRVVKTFKDHFIRRLDEKFFHCGHCNCIQYIHGIDDHIETQHTKNHETKLKIGNNNKREDLSKSSTTVKSKAQSRGNAGTPVKTKKHSEKEFKKLVRNNAKGGFDKSHNGHNRHNDNEHNANDNRNFVDTYSEKSNISINNAASKNTDINDNIFKSKINFEISNNVDENIVILPFGYKITVSKFSYNIICDKIDAFYCALCDVTYKKDVLKIHLEDLNHLAILNRTPFIMPFSYHLIRAIRDSLHCTICNCPVRAYDIYSHIQNPHHTTLLQIALNINNQQTKTDNGSNQNDNEQNNADSDNEHNEVTTASEDNGLINDTFNTTTEEVSFDFEEYVYLKLKNNYVRVSNSSYHTLVSIGDGSRYCFVCAIPVDYYNILKHVDSRAHVENVDKYRFLEKYEDHLLRQIYLLYHCSICNVLVNKKDLKSHLDWPEHLEQKKTWNKNIKKLRRNEMKGGVREIVVFTQKEIIYFGKSPDVKVLFNVTTEKVKDASDGSKSKKKDGKLFLSNVPDAYGAKKSTNINDNNKNTVISNDNAVMSTGNAVINKNNNVISSKSLPISSNNSLISTTSAKNTKISTNNEMISNPELQELAKKSKMIILKDNVYVVPWENWNSIAKIKNGYKCNICQKEMQIVDVASHCDSEWHSYALNKPFVTYYAPALMRKINEATLNCLICNTEVSNKEHLVNEHVTGKRHVKNYDIIIKNSSADAYQACGEEIMSIDSR